MAVTQTRRSVGFVLLASSLLGLGAIPLGAGAPLDNQYFSHCLKAINPSPPYNVDDQYLGTPECGAQACTALYNGGQVPTDGLCNALDVHLANSSLLVRVLQHPDVSQDVYLHAHAKVLNATYWDGQTGKWLNRSESSLLRDAFWPLYVTDNPLLLELNLFKWDDIPSNPGPDVQLVRVEFHPMANPASNSASAKGPLELYYGDPAYVADLPQPLYPA